MREAETDFTIDGVVYRMRKLNVVDGAWLAFLLMSRMKTTDIRDALGSITESDFKRITELILNCTTVRMNDTGTFLPVYHPQNGVVADSLKDNAKAVFDLVFEGIGFNLKPFFEKAANQE